jgi:excisionase family DNA binding protein
MKPNIQQQLLDRWAQIRNEVICTGAVGSYRFKVRRRDLLGPTGMQAGDELLGIAEVAQRLGVPKSTVYELTRHRAHVRHDHPLPCFKVGRRLKFNWSTVIAWLDTLEKEGAR